MTDAFGRAHDALNEIEVYLADRRSALLDAQRRFELYGVDPDAFKEFTEKPYILRPIGRQGKFELIIPKFIQFSAGWPVRTDGNYVVYQVSKFIDLLTPLPEWLKKEIGWQPAVFGAHFEDNAIVVDWGDAEKAMEELGGGKHFYSKRVNKLFFRPRYRFDIMRALVRSGILPYSPKAIPGDLLRDPRGKIKLRKEQMRDWLKFKDLSSASIFAKGGAGKTFWSLYAMDCIKGSKIIFAPTRAILDQWEARIRVYASHLMSEVEFMTYQALTKRVPTKRYTFAIFDEVQRIPSNTGLIASNLTVDTRAGLSATPWREDNNEDLIPALCGFPMGMDWPTGESPDTTVWVTKDEFEWIKTIASLAKTPTSGKTFIYVYRLKVGERIASYLKVPFVNGKSSKQLKTMQENDIVVVSKIADAGISMNVTKIIEADWLGGRAEIGQRGLRAQHAEEKGEFHIVMTKAQYREGSKDVSRLAALYNLSFDVKVREASSR